MVIHSCANKVWLCQLKDKKAEVWTQSYVINPINLTLRSYQEQYRTCTETSTRCQWATLLTWGRSYVFNIILQISFYLPLVEGHCSLFEKKRPMGHITWAFSSGELKIWISYTQGCFMPSLVETGPSEVIFFKYSPYIFIILLLSPFKQGCGPLFVKIWIPSTHGCFVPSLVQIGPSCSGEDF